MKENNYRLIPGRVTYWGDIAGNIETQKDLVEYISTHGGGGGAAAVWGSISGNISDQTDLMNTLSSYALLSDIPSLDGYATESWVSNQGYITSESLSGYATESWVSEQGYITSSALSGYATESWVSSQGFITSIPSEYVTQSWVSEQGFITSAALSGYATESYVQSQGYLTSSNSDLAPLFNKSEGVLKYDYITKANTAAYIDVPFTDSGTVAGNCVYNINGDILGFNPDMGNQIYKFDYDSFSFEPLVSAEGDAYDIKPMWTDTEGNIYYGLSTTVDLETGEFAYWDTGVFYREEWGEQVEDNVQNYYRFYQYGAPGQNVFTLNGHIYVLDGETGMAIVFNPQTKQFDSYIPFSYPTYSDPDWYNWCTNYNGHIIYSEGGEMYEVSEVISDNQVTGVEVNQVVSPYFPLTFEYDYNYYDIHCEYVHQTTINNVVRTFYFYGDTGYVMELVDGAWIPTQMQDSYSASTAGAMLGELAFGYTSVSTGKLVVWNFGASRTFYGWGDVLEEEDLEPYATKNWVQQQGYISSNQISDYNFVQDPHHMLDLSGQTAKLNNKDIATTDLCIINNEYRDYGPMFEAKLNTEYYEFMYYFTTPSGRLFMINGDMYREIIDNGDGYYDYSDGQFSINVSGESIWKTTDGKMFAADMSTFDIYIWDDNNSDWTFVVSAEGVVDSASYVWVCGDTLRYADTYKLVESGGTYSWVSDTLSTYYEGRTIAFNSNVYLTTYDEVSGHIVMWQYDETNKGYTLIGGTNGELYNGFVFGSELFLPAEDGVYKVTSFTPTYDPDTYVDTLTDIVFTELSYFYGEFENKLWTVKDIDLGWCYYSGISAPAVPSTNGTYVLKAVRTNAGVTYSWVEDVDAQAIQITNQILG